MLFAAAHVIHVAIPQTLDAHRARHFLYASVDVVGVRACHFKAEGEFVIGSQVEELRLRVLEHVSHFQGELVGLAFCRILPADGHLSASSDPRLEVRDKAVQTLGDGRLPSPGSSAEQHAFSGLDLKVDSIKESRSVL